VNGIQFRNATCKKLFEQFNKLSYLSHEMYKNAHKYFVFDSIHFASLMYFLGSAPHRTPVITLSMIIFII